MLLGIFLDLKFLKEGYDFNSKLYKIIKLKY